MKRYIFLALIFICFILSGCSGESYTLDKKENQIVKVEKIEQKETAPEANIKKDSEKSATQDKPDYTQILDKYRALYEAEEIYSDLYFDGKFLLIGKSSVVCLIVIGDVEDATVISKQNIAKAEDFVSGEFGSITIYDKTGETVGIMVKPEETKDIISAIYGG